MLPNTSGDIPLEERQLPLKRSIPDVVTGDFTRTPTACFGCPLGGPALQRTAAQLRRAEFVLLSFEVGRTLMQLTDLRFGLGADR